MRTRQRGGGGVMLWALADLLLIGGLVLLSDKSGLTRLVATSEHKATVAEHKATAAETEAAALRARLCQRDQEYDTLLVERDGLKRQYDTLLVERDGLKRQYDTLKANSDTQAKLAVEQLAKLNDKLAALQKMRESDQETYAKKAKSWDEEVARLNKHLEGLLAQIKGKDETIAGLEKKLLRTQGTAHQLLGLKTRTTDNGWPVLKRVAIVIDTSGSMNDPLPGVGSRWGLTQQLITTWVTHLGAKQAFVIQFSDAATLHTTKDKRDAYDLTDKADRDELTDVIRKWEPKGATATHDALLRAYKEHEKAPLDAIIVFTDGAPTVPEKDPEEAVFRLCGQQKLPVPVNVIGVGVYVNTVGQAAGTNAKGQPGGGANAKEQAADGAKFLTFMIRLADATGGSFQAR